MASEVPYKWISELPVEAQRQLERNFLHLQGQIIGAASDVDCIIDGSLTTSTPGTHTYKNLTDCLASETTSSTKVLSIGVIGRPSSTITESSNMTSSGPIAIRQMGLAAGSLQNLGGQASGGRQVWDFNNKVLSSSGGTWPIYIEGMEIVNSGAAITQPFSTFSVVAFNCRFSGMQPAASNTRAITAIQSSASGSAFCVLINCHLLDIETVSGTGRSYLYGCNYMFGGGNATAGVAMTPGAAGNWHGESMTFSCGAGSPTKGISITGSNVVTIDGVGGAFYGGSNATLPLSIVTGSGGTVSINLQGAASQVLFNASVSAASGDTSIKGDSFGSVTVLGNSNPSMRYVDVFIQGGGTNYLDITGPCYVRAHSKGGVNNGVQEEFILRGSSIYADLSGGAVTANPKLKLIGVTDSLVCMMFQAPSGGGRQAYTIDAASARSVVLTAGTTNANWSVASTNASATVLVITESGVTPSGAAGGSLAGTFPSPTFSGRDASVDKINQDMLPTWVGEIGQVTTFPAATGGSPSGAAGGSLSGTYPNPTFAGRDSSVDKINQDILPSLLVNGIGQPQIIHPYDDVVFVNDTAWTATSADRIIWYSTLTASRIVQLPAASSVPPGTPFLLIDGTGGASKTKTISFTPIGFDFSVGSTTITTAGGVICATSNGTNAWQISKDPLDPFSNLSDLNNADTAIKNLGTRSDFTQAFMMMAG